MDTGVTMQVALQVIDSDHKPVVLGHEFCSTDCRPEPRRASADNARRMFRPSL